MNLPSTNPELPILIAGPTASGKSELALRFAETQGGVIVNADALQVFDGWRILTARPPAADEARAPHHLYGHVPFDQTYSVGHWLRDVAPFLSGKERPIIVGGTGLYFSALTEGLAEIPMTPPEVRSEGDAFLRDKGLAAMVAELDPLTASRIDLNNPARVQRAWEVLRTTSRGLADWQDDTPPALLPLRQAQGFVMNADKEWLNDRISRRFDLMMDQGALEEARMMEPNWDPALLSSKAIGAPELIAHLRGDLTLDEAREAAKIATRQYAKRQRTWFRSRMKAWTPIDLG
nr:tRNA (adenosine(37)-N6)-dimethylallyltransferase MiaA [Actibacterium pelagium]